MCCPYSQDGDDLDAVLCQRCKKSFHFWSQRAVLIERILVERDTNAVDAGNCDQHDFDIGGRIITYAHWDCLKLALPKVVVGVRCYVGIEGSIRLVDFRLIFSVYLDVCNI